MSLKGLHEACQKLPFQKGDFCGEEIIHETLAIIDSLAKSYGYASVVAELSQIWSLEMALSFFGKIEFPPARQSHPATIATHFRKAYNGGVERVQAQLINIWNAMGYRVILITEEPANPLDYHYPDHTKRLLIPTCSNLRDRLSVLQKYCLEEKVDIFINHAWGNPSVLWECVLLKFLRISYVQYIHGHFAWNFSIGKSALYAPEIFKLCTLVLSLSETNARFYQMCGCNSFLIQNPIPDDLLSTTIADTSSLSNKHILFVGRLSIEKHPFDVIHIFKSVHEQYANARLDIVGSDEGNFIPKMKQFCENCNLSDAVSFHRFQSQKDLRTFYRNACLLLFTSYMEGYPMVLLEAKAYGLPIVMYDLSYLSLINDKKGVLVAPVGDMQQMSKNIIKILSDQNLRMNLGRNSRLSFENFRAYPIESQWHDIFGFCFCNRSYLNNSNFYDPSRLTSVEKNILPSLLSLINKGYETTFSLLKNDFNYKLGKFILYIPRKFLNICKSIAKK